jgi:hypothetical protein
MNISNKDYKFDIALSFLQQDEQVALDLHERLSPNFDVFVYSKKQEDLAGTDGTESFRKVFREDSRLVIVLYRDGWGKTPWTRIEEGAISDRFLKEGWDWLLFIMVDSKSTPPPWLPETRIRLSLPDYGIEQAIGAIKARAQELGSRFHREDAVERGKRLERQVAVRAERKRLLGSTEGVEAAQKEVREIRAAIAQLADEIKKSSSDLKLLVGSSPDSTVLTNKRVSVVIYFCLTYGNTLENSFLVIKEINGRVFLPQERGHYMVPTEPKELTMHKFDPDITPGKTWCWRSQSDPERYYTSGDMADYCIKIFLNLIDRADRGDIPLLDHF